MTTLHTIGHSTLGATELVALLHGARIDAVADVRSVPASRAAPQHDRAALAASLAAAGIGYVYLGDLLGGRPRHAGLVTADGRVDYAAMAAEPAFARGLGRLVDGMAAMTVAVLCAEADPSGCHRRLLVGRALAEPDVRPAGVGDVELAHIARDGTVTSEPAAALLGTPDLFGARPWTSAHRLPPHP